MRLVGTAGHVDHGKSTLVQALTGIYPDRLKQEQERAMTIELGFAWLTLPHGETISFVDVPGHEAFIKNMLAGVGGIDVALVVIAADEGIMPQTREHLAILDLLQVRKGVVALTKTDLALEEGWLDLVTNEIRSALRVTSLHAAEIIPVSARTGRGLNELQLAVERALAGVPLPPDRQRPRLPIDRVFTMSGFGTVVTGTLSDGSFQTGAEVEIAPRALRSRIRGLQSHKQRVDIAPPGGRVAINLANLATDEMQRGDVVILPGSYTPTTMLDVQIDWLGSAPAPLAHSQELDLFLYASEVIARVRLLEHDTLAPGQRGWAQLLLAEPVIAAQGDRFVLRYPSPSITVGGGIIVEPYPTARHKRRRSEIVERLARALQGTPSELVTQYVETHPAAELGQISNGVGLDSVQVQAALEQALASGALFALAGERSTFYVAPGTWRVWCADLVAALTTYHEQFPMRAGMPRQELKSQLRTPPTPLDLILTRAAEESLVRVTDKTVALAAHQVKFDAATQARVDALLAQFARAPYNPPSVGEAEQAVGHEVLNALLEDGTLERIAPNVLLTPTAVSEMQTWVTGQLQAHGEITAAQVRDHFDTSRKYAIAFLEYLDTKRVTRRVGDSRVLR